MSPKIKFAVIGLPLLIIFASCMKSENIGEPNPENNLTNKQIVSQLEPTTNYQFDSFKVIFDGRKVEENTTTFNWTVHGSANELDPQKLMIQLPPCADLPLSFNPENATIMESDIEPVANWVQWPIQHSTGNQASRQYSITYEGNVPVGEVYLAISNPEETEIAVMKGPCQGYDISGLVFVDANNDGLLNVDEEAGIANVVLELTDSQGAIETIVTQADGRYNIRKLEGIYSINLPLDPDSDFFNAHLENDFSATNLLTREVSVPPTSAANNFGFYTLHEDIVMDIENGDRPTDGETLLFWREEFRKALIGNQTPRTYNGKTLFQMLNEIETLFLKTPYFLSGDNKIQDAYNILSMESTVPYDLLFSELFATELNHVVFRGIVDQSELQLVLIAWGEGLLVQNPPTQLRLNSGKNTIEPNTILIDPHEMSRARALYRVINTGGGGGVDEKN